MPFAKNLNDLNNKTNTTISSTSKPVYDTGYNKQNISRLEAAPELIYDERVELQKSYISTQTAYVNHETNTYGLTKPRVPTGPEYPDVELNHLIVEKMWRTICVKNLFAFYTQDQLQNLVNRTCKHDWKILKREWNFQSVDSVTDLCVVALYDVIIVNDDSGSMHYVEPSEKVKRWDILKEVVKTITFFASLLDDNGIDLMFLNYPEIKKGVKSFSEVEKLFKTVVPNNDDPIGATIRERIFNQMVLPFLNPSCEEKLNKPLLIINVTDGLPVDKPDIVTAILRCRELCGKSKYGENAMAFAFAQVGKDKSAAAWLKEIDTHPQIGHLIDCTSEFYMEQEECGGPTSGFTEATWVLKLMVGAILDFYDKADEKDASQPANQSVNQHNITQTVRTTTSIPTTTTTSTPTTKPTTGQGVLKFFGLK